MSLPGTVLTRPQSFDYFGYLLAYFSRLRIGALVLARYTSGMGAVCTQKVRPGRLGHCVLYGLMSISVEVLPWLACSSTIRSFRPVCARARRSASSFASLPELTKKQTTQWLRQGGRQMLA